ncbi:cytochrome P450 2G1-like [Otolemur garnettii]|uniref:cytochrome P450 2G1-like n=1 Tax=Otolemur garnettii TaxID=30611 RepID=UPI000C7EE466|nr:cytochrome P450 2G1-like [Otolemur garnettii]
MELGGALTIFLELCLTCLTIILVWKRINKGGKLPPGPTPIPFLGNLLQVRPDATFQSFMKLREKYGPVFTVYMGPRPVVVLCGHKAVKEALVDQGDEFSGRGELATIEQNFQGHGVVMANGDRWKILRRFSLTILRDFGMGKRSIEERIQEEAGYLLEEFRKTKGAPIEPTFFLSRTVSNVISSVVFGSRFDYEDKQFLRLLQLMNETFIEMSTPWAQLYDMYSGIMQYLPGKHNHIYNLIEELKDFVASKVKINEASLDPQNPRDFIDCFLIKMHQVPPPLPESFPLTSSLSTACTLTFYWGQKCIIWSSFSNKNTSCPFFWMLPAKIHEEIDQVIGPQRIPSVNDRVKMPYTDAVIHEIQRLLDFVPMGVPHSVIRDTHFRGYLLPKGTDVFPLLGSVLKDPKYFRYPDAFYPQHFLDEQGCFKKNEAFVAFSSGRFPWSNSPDTRCVLGLPSSHCSVFEVHVKWEVEDSIIGLQNFRIPESGNIKNIDGKRVCLGEALARMELFLYLTSVLQNFSLRPLVPPADIDVTPKLSGFGNIPPTYELCLVAR